MKVPDIPPHYIWYTLSAIFFIIGIIGGLGEWVFHWWGEPWDVGAPISLLLGVLTLAWGASAKDVRVMHGDLRSGFTDVAAAQREHTDMLWEVRQGQREQTEKLGGLQAGQAEQTGLLRELVTSFRRPP